MPSLGGGGAYGGSDVSGGFSGGSGFGGSAFDSDSTGTSEVQRQNLRTRSREADRARDAQQAAAKETARLTGIKTGKQKGAKSWGEWGFWGKVDPKDIESAQYVGLAPGVTREDLQNKNTPLGRYSKQYASVGGGRNTAIEALEGKSPSFGGYARDFFGVNNPGGFLGSTAGGILGAGVSLINPLAGLAYKGAQYSQGVGPIATAERMIDQPEQGYGIGGFKGGTQTAWSRPTTKDRSGGGQQRQVQPYLQAQQARVSPYTQNYLGAPSGNTWQEWGASRKSSYG